MCLGFFKGIIGVFYKDFPLYWVGSVCLRVYSPALSVPLGLIFVFLGASGSGSSGMQKR